MALRLFKNPLFYVLLLLILVPLLLPLSKYEGFLSSESNSTCEIEPSKFKDSTKNGKVFTLFYANWCGHCKNMKPNWVKAANEVNVNGQQKMVMVDLGDNDDLAQEQLRKDYNIRGYPTIVDLDGGKQVGEYSGERSVDALKNHALNM